MNILLFKAHELDSNSELLLEDRRAKHLIDVIGVTVGQSLKVGELNGKKGLGYVKACSANQVRLLISLNEPPAERHPLTLVVAMPRPKMLRRIFRTAAEFGVEELHLIHSYRVEKSFWQSPLLKESKINDALMQGAERSGDTLLPRVSTHRRFKPFVEDVLPELAADQPILIAHPGANSLLTTGQHERGVILIGPEGGFIPYEVEKAMECGALPVSLGERILSVDTAVCAALAQRSR